MKMKPSSKLFKRIIAFAAAAVMSFETLPLEGLGKIKFNFPNLSVFSNIDFSFFENVISLADDTDETEDILDNAADADNTEPEVETSKSTSCTYELSLSEYQSTYGVQSSGEYLIINLTDQLIALSHVEPKEYQNLKIRFLNSDTANQTGDLTETEKTTNKYTFQGIGSYDYPFSGTFEFNSKVKINQPLLRSVSDDAKITFAENATITVGTNSGEFFLIDAVKHGTGTDALAIDNVSLIFSDDNDGKIRGIIDCIDDSAKVSISISLSTEQNAFTVSGNENAGFICGTLGKAAELTVKSFSITENVDLSSGADSENDVSSPFELNVTSSGGNAGGFVGAMGENAKLDIQNFSISKNVTSDSADGTSEVNTKVVNEIKFDINSIGHNAGGIVGRMDSGAKLTIANEFSQSGTVSAKYSAGGVVGKMEENAVLTVGKADEESADTANTVLKFDLTITSNTNYAGGIAGEMGEKSNITFASDVAINGTITADNSAGGAVGKMEDNAVLTVGKADEESADSANTVLKFDLTITSNTNYAGGIAGEMGEKSNITFASDIAISGTITADNSAGGVVGIMGDSAVLTVGNTSEESSNTATFTIKISSTNGYAGGIAGEMGKMAKATFASDIAISGTITADKSAGGAVGKMEDNAVLTVGNTSGESSNTANSVLNYDLTVTSNTNYAGGIAGEMGEKAKATFASDIAISGTITADNSAGGVVGIMGNSAVLTVGNTDDTSSGSTNISLEISSTNGCAGGLAGEMCENSHLLLTGELSLSSTSTVKAVKSAGGAVGKMSQNSKLEFKNAFTFSGKVLNAEYAGGIVGSADVNIGIKINDNVITVKDAEVGTAEITENAGGFIGYYILGIKPATESDNNADEESTDGTESDVDTSVVENSGLVSSDIDFSNVQISNVKLYAVNNAGGLIGKLENYDNDLEITVNRTINSVSSSCENYGGVIGLYMSNNLSNTLSITGTNGAEVDCNNSAKVGGGVLGKIDSDNMAYVEISDVSVTYRKAMSGGLVGDAGSGNNLVIGSATVKAASTLNLYGGLVGVMNSGVMRISGVTDLTEAYYATYTIANPVGQILGYSSNTVVYAVGNGSDYDAENGTGWTFKRSKSAPRLDDIGSYGEVIRVDGTKLKEDELFTIDNHVVTVREASTTVSNLTEFALLAISIQTNIDSYSNNGALVLTKNPDLSADITISENAGTIDLSDTGITGLTRDDGIQTYKGSFNGNGSTILLATGETYGLRDGSAASGTGSGQIYNHGYIGLFAKIGGSEITVKDVSLGGTIDFGTGAIGTVNAGMFAANIVDNKVTFTDVKILKESDTQNSHINFDFSGSAARHTYIGGIVGTATSKVNLDFNGCEWSGTITESGLTEIENNECYIGGFVGYAISGSTINVSENGDDRCMIGGKIELAGDAKNLTVGGLIAYASSANITITALDVNGAEITETASNPTDGTIGGFLGYSWANTVVKITDLTIKNSTLNASKKKFGGLVYTASKYWKISEDGIKYSNGVSFNGRSDNSTPSALLVSSGTALYLEVCLNTKGNALAYSVDANTSVTITENTYFDELVGKNLNGTSSGVVSIATVGSTNANGTQLIDQDGCNTYKKQLATDYNNGTTRYYYNLDTIREPNNDDDKSTVDLSTVNSGEKMLLWSVYKNSSSSLQSYFGKNIGTTISGEIDLTGLSYYPIDISESVTISDSTTITFGNEKIESAESEVPNKKTTDSKKQHYLMQCGLFKNVSTKSSGINFTVDGLILKGSIGKTGSSGSGALICGTFKGSTDGSTPATAILKVTGVEFDGITITGFEESSTYSPLFINQIGSYTTVGLTNVTLSGYTDSENDTVNKVATSLIGKVGSDSGTDIGLSFSKIELNGKTDKSIFTRATFLESFEYKKDRASSCSGTYTFNEGDVATYGTELSNSSGGPVSGRNNDSQWTYFDTGNYVSDTINGGETNSAETAASYFANDYLRYVAQKEEVSDEYCYRELDINQRKADMLTGCGTYGDPYIITDGEQLTYITDPSQNAYWIIQVNENAMKAQNGALGENYHNQDETGKGDIYLKRYSADTWLRVEKKENKYITVNEAGDEVDENSSVVVKYTDAEVLAYLRNAYYMIDPEDSEDYSITLGGGEFCGVGANNSTNTFSGVIIGKKNEKTGEYPTVKIESPDSSKDKYGGLVKYADGCVIKDLIIDYTDAYITVSESENTTTIPAANTSVLINSTQESEYQNFFGGVIGYVWGGDNIIDNVQVKYSDNSVKTTTGNNERLINIGGYVGLVGGNYKKGGTVIFRNMTDEYKLTKVNGEDITSENTGDVDVDKYYWNPYVGRVLDAAVLYDGTSSTNNKDTTLSNTNKNYKIPNISGEDNQIDVSKWTLNNTEHGMDGVATVHNAEELWILSAICASGGAGANTKGYYIHSDEAATISDTDKILESYYYGKVRSGLYDCIGQERDDTEKANIEEDEKEWGGIGGKNAAKTPYLIKKFTSKLEEEKNSNYYAAKRITGIGKCYSITLEKGDYDMTEYGNGFRGFGSAYTNAQVESKNKGYSERKVINVRNFTGNGNTISFYRDVYEYPEETVWHTYQVGLFTDLYAHDTGTEGSIISDLTLSGRVCVKNKNNKIDTYAGIYAGCRKFSGQASNTDVTFNNVNLKDVTVNGQLHAAGGLIGYINKGKNYYLNNCSYNNIEVDALQYSGGFFGRVGEATAFYFNYTKETTLSNAKITVSKDATNAYAGGLIGYIVKPVTFSVDDTETQSAALSQTKVSVTIPKATNNAGAGGFIGYTTAAVTVNSNGSADKLKQDTIDVTVSEAGNDAYAGGFIGRGATFNANIKGKIIRKNIKISVSNVTNNTYAGGLNGYNGNTVTITANGDVLQDGTKITLTNVSSTSGKIVYAGGLIGQQTSNGSTTITTTAATTFDNTEITLNGEAYKAFAGGIIGFTDKTMTFNVGETTEDSEQQSTATLTQTNVSITIPKATNNAYAGGFIGSSSSVTMNSYGSADELKQDTIKITVSQALNNAYAGGFIGSGAAFTATIEGKVIRKNITVAISNVTNSDTYAGGLNGYNSGAVTITANGDISQDETMVKLTDVYYASKSVYAGGLIGRANSKTTISTNAQTEFKNTTITISGETSTATNAYAGGLIGYSNDAQNITVDGTSKWNNTKISISNAINDTFAGGLNGYNNGAVTITANGDISQDYVTITLSDVSSNSKTAYTGGLIGKTNSTATINTKAKSEFKNTIITISGETNKTTNVNAGGLIGNINNTTNITADGTTKWSDTKISISDVKTSACAGGLIGKQTTNSLTINTSAETTFDNTTINLTGVGNAAYVGGMIGHTDKLLIITTTAPTTFYNTKIKLSNVTNDTNAGGLIGYTNNTVDMCNKAETNLNNTTISLENVATASSKNTNAGGLIGFSNSRVSINCDTNGNVSDESAKIKINNLDLKRIANESNVSTYTYLGGFIGKGNNALYANNLSISNSIIFNGSTLGTNRAGGVVGDSESNIKLYNIDVDNIKVMNYGDVGGLVGYASASNNIYVSSAGVKNSDIVTTYIESPTSKDTDVGGIVGRVNTNGKTFYGYNILVSNNLLGYYSYEGSYSKDDLDKLGEDTITIRQKVATTVNNKTTYTYPLVKYSEADMSKKDTLYSECGVGSLVGKVSSNNKITFRISGLCVTGDYLPYSVLGYGKMVDEIGIIYTDYTGQSGTDDKNTNGTAPYAVVNPKSNISGLENIVTTNGAAWYDTDTSMGKKIMDDLSNDPETTSTAWNKIYNKVISISASFTDTYGSIMTTYNDVIKAEGGVEVQNNFPVLFLDTNDSQKITEIIKSYATVLTNDGEYGSRTVGNNINEQFTVEFSAKTYRLNTTTNKFEELTNKATLKATSDKKTLAVNSSRYDNTLNQFTVVSVKYYSPIISSEYYELQIPVVVKKVLGYGYNSVVKSGADYYSSAYSNVDTIAIANHSEPVTAFLTFTYERVYSDDDSKNEWKTYMNNGENFITGFDKTVDVDYQDNTLPKGTLLTLVDANKVSTGGGNVGAYYYTCDGNGEPLKLSDFKDSEGNAWQPVSLCDLLGVYKVDSTSKAISETDVIFQEVTGEDTSEATVKIGNTYYKSLGEASTVDWQKVGEETSETDETTKTIETAEMPATIGDMNALNNGYAILDLKADDAQKYLYNGTYYISEYYYITIQTPADTSYALTSRVTNATVENTSIPTQADSSIYSTSSDGETFDRYVIGNIYSQSLTITATDNINAEITQTNNVIKAKVESKITVDSGVLNIIGSNIKVKMNHVLDFGLTLITKDNQTTSVQFEPTTSVMIKNYKIYSADGETQYATASNINCVRSSNHLLVDSGNIDIAITEDASSQNLTSLKNMLDKGCIITADVEISVSEDDYRAQFDESTVRENDTDQNGISPMVYSKLGTEGNYLTKSATMSERYYTTGEASATLVCDADSKDLGINPTELESNPSQKAKIHMTSVYNLSSVYDNTENYIEKNSVKNVNVEYEITLLKKNEKSSYEKVNINDYLNFVSLTADGSEIEFKANGTSDSGFTYTSSGEKWVISGVWRDENNSGTELKKNQNIDIDFEVITGSTAESSESFTYANYKVLVSAKLYSADENGNSVQQIEKTSAEDHIIYTNARLLIEKAS